MNRKQRRAFGKHINILIDFGRLGPRDPNRGAPVACYLCEAAHFGSGLARIARDGDTLYAPLCDTCLDGGSRSSNAIVRKLLDTPALEVVDGGELSDEQFDALRAKQNESEH